MSELLTYGGVICGAAIALFSCAAELAPSVKTGPIAVKLALAGSFFFGVALLNLSL